MYKDRHIRIERICEQCGNPFMARQSSIKKGKGRFCSLNCANKWQDEDVRKMWGFENGKKYWEQDHWSVHWKDENGWHNTTYPKWWWLVNVGDVPDGYVITYKDKNQENINPTNFECVPKAKINRENSQYSIYTPREISLEEKVSHSNGTKKNWVAGIYDKFKGDGHPNWRGGKSKEEYPREFYNIRRSVLERDNYRCQVCGKDISNERFQQVHHRNANKNDNDPNNLLSLCIHCHGQVHSTKPTSDIIMALRSELYQ